ncbi:MAG: hypothetical protein LBS55_10345 [Prevotellaceae bacterium]|nr:hypothetical protein [Prevotellaceae bacterium]
MINKCHELALLADTINRQSFEDTFSPLFSEKGDPCVPIRLMVGCLLLKHLENLDNKTHPKYWIRDPSM